MSSYFDSANAGSTGREELPSLNVGTYKDSLSIEKLEKFDGTDPKKPGYKYFKATFKMLKAENGFAAGDLVQMFETVEGGNYPKFLAQANARVKKLLGAIAGLDLPSDINAKVTLKDYELATSEAQPFKGSVVSAVVTASNPKFPNVVCSPSTGDVALRPTLPTPPAAPVVERYPHPAMPGHTYDAAGGIYDATGKKVN